MLVYVPAPAPAGTSRSTLKEQDPPGSSVPPLSPTTYVSVNGAVIVNVEPGPQGSLAGWTLFGMTPSRNALRLSWNCTSVNPLLGSGFTTSKMRVTVSPALTGSSENDLVTSGT